MLVFRGSCTVRFSLQVPESHLNAMRRMDPGAFASQPRSCECASCGRNFDSRTPGGRDLGGDGFVSICFKCQSLM